MQIINTTINTTMAKLVQIDTTVPQLVDPALDCMMYTLLSRLRGGVDVWAGVQNARRALLLAQKPLLIVVTTDVYDRHVARIVGDLRTAAFVVGVPIVYSLTQEFLGSASKMRGPQMVVTILGVPDNEARRLLCAVMSKAAEACAAFSKAVAAASNAVQQPTFVDVTPCMPAKARGVDDRGCSTTTLTAMNELYRQMMGLTM